MNAVDRVFRWYLSDNRMWGAFLRIVNLLAAVSWVVAIILVELDVGCGVCWLLLIPIAIGIQALLGLPRTWWVTRVLVRAGYMSERAWQVAWATGLVLAAASVLAALAMSVIWRSLVPLVIGPCLGLMLLGAVPHMVSSLRVRPGWHLLFFRHRSAAEGFREMQERCEVAWEEMLKEIMADGPGGAGRASGDGERR